MAILKTFYIIEILDAVLKLQLCNRVLRKPLLECVLKGVRTKNPITLYPDYIIPIQSKDALVRGGRYWLVWQPPFIHSAFDESRVVSMVWKAGHNSDGTLDAFRRRRDDGGVGGVIRHESDDAPRLVR